MKPSLLKGHFSTNHPELASENPSYFERKAVDLKRMRFDGEGKPNKENVNSFCASYMVSL